MLRVDKILAVIQKDANGTKFLKKRWQGGIKYCVLGGLLHEAGCEPGLDTSFPTLEQQQVLLAEYGLNFDCIYKLVVINDDHLRRPSRQRALAKEVVSWSKR